MPATCTTAGLTDGTMCSVCETTLVTQSVIPAKGHTPVTLPGKDATCTATGLTAGTKCSVCNEVIVPQETIEKLAHTPVTVTGSASTCTAPGLTDGVKCSVCGEMLTAQEIIPANGHTEETIPGKEATCIASGLTDGKKCSACKTVLVQQEVIPALGHTEKTLEAVAATCTATGLTEGKQCTVCEEILVAQKIVSALGHTYDAKVTAPTCTAIGFTTYTCSKCEATYKDNYTDALGHTFGEWGTTVSATCTEEGTMTRVCLRCPEQEEKSISAKGHTTAMLEAKAPTCTQTGLKAGAKCSVCDAILVPQEIVSALGHDYKAEVIAPTKQAGGYTLHTCTRCTDAYKDTFTDPLPTVNIQHFTAERKVEYRYSIQFKATVTNPVAGAQIHWFVDGKEAGTGETHNVLEAKKSYTIVAKYMKDGKVLDETETEKVTVDTGFFAKLKAFFKYLFKKSVPVLQVYLVIEKVD